MKQSSEAPKQKVENISCILPQSSQLGGLFLGNVFGAQNAAILKQYGIRAVITASAQTNISYSAEDIPSHLRIDAHDKDQYYIVEHVNDCIHFIETNRKITNVYVHCYAGVSRSSAIVAAYLMWKYRWSLQKTINFLVFKRVVAKPNDGFLRQLQQVQAKLNIKSESGTPQNKAVNQMPQEQMIKPKSPPLTDSSSFKRPSSTNGSNQMVKPQSPPLQLQNFHPASNSSQQVYESKVDPYPYHLENSWNNKVPQQKQAQKLYQNHNSIPLPKVLAKKQEQINIQNDYYQQGNKDSRQYNRKSTFNDYLSPQLMPTSPRQNQAQKASLGKTTLNRASLGNKVDNNEGSLYTTMNAMNTSKKSSYQSQQKSKTGSRCIIRPKDLPGYRNY